jgi:hypothetical protein
MAKAKNTEDFLIEQNDAILARLDDIDRQLAKLFSFHGSATWESIKRQAADNVKAQGTKIPFQPSQHFGEVGSGKPLAN